MQNVSVPKGIGGLALALALTGCASIEQTGEKSMSKVNPNYVASSTQEIVKDIEDNCVRTINWTEESGLVECNASAQAPVIEEVVGASLVSFSGRALFEFDSFDITRAGRQQLDQLTAKLNNQTTITGIEIVGHTDSIGSDSYNMSLSQRRAESVKDYLEQSLDTVVVNAVGKGESTPIADNATDSGRALNRRVEVKIAASVER